MKNLVIGLSLLALSGTAVAGDFFGGNDGEWKMGPYGPYWDESDWPKWTPMYWMEEMMDEWDSDDDYGSFGGMPYGGMPYGGGMPMGVPMMGSPSPMPMPQMQPMPMMAPQGGMMAPLPPAPVAPPVPAANGGTPMPGPAN